MFSTLVPFVLSTLALAGSRAGPAPPACTINQEKAISYVKHDWYKNSSTPSPDGCCAACQTDQLFAAFTWHHLRGGQCFLTKTTAQPMNASAITVSGAKNPPTPPPPPPP
eukprot:gene5098-5191_t